MLLHQRPSNMEVKESFNVGDSVFGYLARGTQGKNERRASSNPRSMVRPAPTRHEAGVGPNLLKSEKELSRDPSRESKPRSSHRFRGDKAVHFPADRRIMADGGRKSGSPTDHQRSALSDNNSISAFKNTHDFNNSRTHLALDVSKPLYEPKMIASPEGPPQRSRDT